MNHALLNGDIARIVFEHLLEVDRSAVLAFALTARPLLAIGMPYLWKELHDIRPLFRILCETESMLRWENPSKERWQRFDYYAGMVQTLFASLGKVETLRNYRGHYHRHMSLSFIEGFSQACSSVGRCHPLPRLSSLKLEGDPEITPLLALTLLSPTLTTLHLNWDSSITAEIVSPYGVETQEGPIQSQFIRALEKTELEVKSLQLCGSFSPFESKGQHCALEDLQWHRLFAPSITDLTIEPAMAFYQNAFEYICLLPCLKSLNLSPAVERLVRDKDTLPGMLRDPAAPIMKPLYSIEDLVCRPKILAEILPFIPDVRRITICVSFWAAIPFAQGDLQSLKPQVEKHCPMLESFTILMDTPKGFMCGNGLRPRWRAIEEIKQTWEKLRFMQEPRRRW